MYLRKLCKVVAAAALLMSSASSWAVLILDVDIGGTNRANLVETDGDAAYVDLISGFGGWSLTIATALAEPDFSGGPAEIHLSVIANCGNTSGCDTLTVTTVSDNPNVFAAGIDLGYVPGSTSFATFSAFLGNGISDWTESHSWTDDFEGTIDFNSAGATYWGLQAVLDATGPGAQSADFRIVSEPGVLLLLGFGLLLMGALNARSGLPAAA